MKFEKTNESETVNRSFTGKNNDYQYDFQTEHLNGRLASVTCAASRLVDMESPNPGGEPVIIKQPQRLGYISSANSVKRMDLPETENATFHVAVFEDFLTFLTGLIVEN